MGAPGWPFGPGFDLNELMRMLQSPGPVNWEVARQVAAETSAIDPEDHDASEVADQIPIDPAERERIADIVRAAQTHVAGATGLSEALRVPADVVDRAEWAQRTLAGLEPVVLALADAISPPAAATAGEWSLPPELAGTPLAAFGPD